MRIAKASEAVGAMVEDVDVTGLDDGEFAAIRQAFLDHGALFFRDQRLTPEEHIAFAERWGAIDINRFFQRREGYPEIAEVLKEPDQKLNIGGGWHTDHSYDAAPAMGSILYALDIPPSGGDTLFAGMAAAYAALDDGMKERIRDLKARHGNAHVFGEESRYRKAVGDRYTSADQAGRKGCMSIPASHWKLSIWSRRRAGRCYRRSMTISSRSASITVMSGARAIWRCGTIARPGIMR